MRAGQVVAFTDASGQQYSATVVAVVGSGPSGFKTLDLTYAVDGQAIAVSSVPHWNDKGPSGFWTLLGETVPAEAREAIDGSAEVGGPRRTRGRRTDSRTEME